MPIQFNADEIFEIAVQIERNGQAFYRKAAEGYAGKTSKDILLKLAEMEVVHEQTFAAMRAELTDVEKAARTFDPEDDAALFLQAVADRHVFNMKESPAAKLTGKETAAQVLRTAIGLEKDSIVFYVGIQDLVGKAFGRERVGNIIHEEMTHVAILSGELAKVL